MKTQKPKSIQLKSLSGRSISQLRKWARRAVNRGVVADKRFAVAGPKGQQIFGRISSECDGLSGNIRVEMANRNIGNKPARA